MLDQIHLQNYGPLQALKWSGLGQINLVLGGNGTGKSFLLKALYTAMRTLEEYKRGNEQSTASEILAQKLYWTFQCDRIGDLVTKGVDGSLSFSMDVDKNHFMYKFGKDTTKQISSLQNDVAPRSSNSIFLPAKEVLSLHGIILKSRETDKSFGFDDTYVDLARALRQPPRQGRNYREFADARKNLRNIIDGRIEIDQESGRWSFRKGNQKFAIGVTAEGVKKIAILDTLLSNRYLDTHSMVFIDEPESALHPKAISELMDIIVILAKSGIQFFLASHSYFVVKKLFLLSQQHHIPIPVLSAEGQDWKKDNLINGIPDNSIINESISLYKEEVELSLS